MKRRREMAPQAPARASDRGVVYNTAPSQTGSSPDLGFLDLEKELREEFQRVVASHQELLGEEDTSPEVQLQTSPDVHLQAADGTEELELLRAENAELRSRLA